MNSAWKTYAISNLIAQHKLLIGDGYRAKNSELSSQGLPFVRAGNIAGGFNFTGADRFPEEALDAIGNKVSYSGDVVFTSKGTVGRFAFVKEDTPRFVYSPQLCFWRSLDALAIDSTFLYYWMQSSEFYGQYRGVASQTDMAEYVSLSDQRRMHITLPPVPEQRAIAHILGTLDDKIELNRKMNGTLDEIARTLFTSWFVTFDPVRAQAEGRQPEGMDAETAALFPDRFVDSELGPLPEGWNWLELGEMLVLNPRRILPHGKQATFLEMKNVATRGHRPLGLEQKQSKGGTRFENGDALLARITPCLENGKTAFVDFLNEGEVGFGSTEYIVMQAKPPLPKIWSYLIARFEPFREFAIQNMTGTSGRQRVGATDIAKFVFVMPSVEVAYRFGELAQPWFDLIRTNDIQSKTLTDLRDTLLPELLSGRIQVPAAEQMVERV